MTLPLEHVKVAFLSADGVEQIELEAPMTSVRQAGAAAMIVTPNMGRIEAAQHHDGGDSFDADLEVSDVEPREFAALVIPGGEGSIEALAADKNALELIRGFMDLDKTVAVLGSACALLVSADVARGRTMAVPSDLRAEIERAGGSVSDRAVHRDQHLITGRSADELPAFCGALIEHLAQITANDRVDEASEESFPASDAPAWGPSAIGARKGKKEGRANQD
jgi:protease I